MKLYTFRFSPNPLKIRIALQELGLGYEAVEINLFRGEHRQPAYTEVNPHRKVPVLEDGAVKVRESGAILTWLGTRHGGSLWPSEPAEVASAHQWLFFEACHLAMQCGVIWWTDKVAPLSGRPGYDPDVVKHALSELERSFGVLEGHLEARPWLLGEAFTLTDCAVGVSLSMVDGTRLSFDAFPRVRSYGEGFRSRASFAAADGEAIMNLPQP
jgi:glutathione S-transferase